MAERDLRQLLVHRDKLVRMRNAHQVSAAEHRVEPGVQKKQKLWSREGRKLLEGLRLEPWTARRRDDLLKLFEELEAQVPATRSSRDASGDGQRHGAAADDASQSRPDHRPAMVLTVGDISRFGNSRQLISYLGLNPSEDSSA